MNTPDAFLVERRARLAAERQLEVKQTELFEANKRLSQHALSLTEQVIEKRDEAEDLRDQNDRAMSDLEDANEATEVAERRLWDSVETIEDGFAVFDPLGVMIAANQAYLSVFDNMECVCPGITYPQVAKILVEEGIVDIAEKTPNEWYEETVDRWASRALEPKTIKLWNGQFIKLVDRRSRDGDTVSLALNITDTILNEEKLTEARRKAEAANRAKSAFLANMSHELRTPMNGVVGMADLLEDTALDDEQKLFVDTIKHSGEALLVLINDVLDYSKVEAKKLDLHLAPFNLAQSIQDIVQLMQPSIQEKSLTVKVDYDLFLPTEFIGDPGRIRQIITNLVGNAIKFSPDGEVLIRVVGLPVGETEEFRVHISVEDTGIGIAEDMIDHIFGEFNQVEDERNRKFEGTGLGLAITKQLVNLMGGEIWVDSEKDVGSNFGFHITLPSKGNAKPEIEPVLVGAPVDVRKMRILAAEDNKTNRLVFSKLVKSLEIDLEFAVNGREAIEKWQSFKPDLVFMDISMPEVDGKEATKAIRAIEAEQNLGHTTIVALTAHALDGDDAIILAAGLDHYLTKPLRKAAIFSRIEGETPEGVVPVFPVIETVEEVRESVPA